MESYLGHELSEARVRAQRIGHGINVQVHETIDFFLVCETEQTEGFVGFAKADVDSRWVQIWDKPRACKLLQLLEGRSRFRGISCQRLRVAIGHDHEGIVARELARVLESLDGLRIHFLLAIGGAEPELRG